MQDIVFRRVRGRIIPIKRKTEVGVGLTAAGIGAAAATGHYAARELKKSHFAFGRSVTERVLSKMSLNPQKYDINIRKAAASKIAGRIFAKKASVILAAGVIASSVLTYAGAKMATAKMKDKEKGFKISSALGAATGLVALTVLARKTKTSQLLEILKAQGKHKSPSAFMALWAKRGQEKTSESLRKFANMGYKGSKRPTPVMGKIKKRTKIDPENQLEFKI